MPATSVLHCSHAGWNRLIGRVMGGLPGAPGSCPYGVEEEEVGRMTAMFPGSAGGSWIVPGDDGPCPIELLMGEHLRSTITSLGKIVSLLWWPITWISLGCNRAWLWSWCHGEWGMVVELGNAWEWRLRIGVTIPQWSRKMIRGLPELSLFVWCIPSVIIWCSDIVIWVLLLWDKQATRWSHIGCLRCWSIRRHHMWTKDGLRQRINSIGDFEWSGV